MGRLVDRKAMDITLEAAAPARGAGVEIALEAPGDGPERERLEETARGLGLAEAVRFLGLRPRSERVAIPTEADALILDPPRERGGSVCRRR